MSKLYNIKPFQYIHILDKNYNKRRLQEGPINFPLQDHELVVDEKIHEMIVIPNLWQVSITNPIERDSEGKIVLDKYSNPKNRWGISEVRTRDKWSKPFPLYPGEILSSKKAMDFINQDSAYHLKALLPFTDEEGEHKIGDEWMVCGPKYFVKRPEMEIVNFVKIYIIVKPNGLRVAASRNFTDSKGVKRLAGEEWLISEEGSYMPNVNETVIGEVEAVILNDMNAAHLKAKNNFTDIYGIKRHAGEEWIVTKETASFHTCGIYEELLGVEDRVVLEIDQYVVIENPFDSETKKNELGKLKLIKGESNFFLNPGETMRDIHKMYILTEGDALLLQAWEDYTDEEGNKRECGRKWMIQGPCSYIPPVSVVVIEKRTLIPLDKNEGIYIRNKTTGEVRTHIGSSYLLQPNEILWSKEMPDKIEKLYLKDMHLKKRDKTRIVAYKCPFNSVMQIYNLKERSNRIVLGPNYLTLDPDEQFCLMSLSGSTPKKEGLVETLYLKLGPNFSTDEFLVETSDHTRLILKLSYNWQFNIRNKEEAQQIFSVRDFIGDLCSTMASKIRSSIATINFEDFHKKSDHYIKKAVFGEKEGYINTSIRFDVCNLLVTDVDIKSVVPSDPNTKTLLEKSVSLAIQLTTKTIQQEYDIASRIKDQEFSGELEKLIIRNKINFQEKNIDLNKLKVESRIIEKTGLSRAQALAKKDAELIESQSKVKYVKKQIESNEIENDFELRKLKKTNENEYLQKSEDQRLELKEKLNKIEIESEKFTKIMEAIEPETLVEIAKSGPELQAKLLSGLNLSGYIVTDGNNPINLFNVAANLTDNSGK
mmetsp:Transcript_37203/g.38582  ORF Transcript_37203/g.38582 Transcript_37203/m.38582 type:complete len:821 (-) Transcript_37203:51-2513(-)